MIQPHSAAEDGLSRDEAARVSTKMYGKLPETRLSVTDILNTIKSPMKMNNEKERRKEPRGPKSEPRQGSPRSHGESRESFKQITFLCLFGRLKCILAYHKQQSIQKDLTRSIV